MKKTRTLMINVELTPEEQEVVDELEKKRDAMAALEEHRVKRDALIVRLRDEFGWTGRDIEPYAGVSNVYIYRMFRKSS